LVPILAANQQHASTYALSQGRRVIKMILNIVSWEPIVNLANVRSTAMDVLIKGKLLPLLASVTNAHIKQPLIQELYNVPMPQDWSNLLRVLAQSRGIK
jgi:ABC-type microcin C transport system duplicated ATPase subunit YejF